MLKPRLECRTSSNQRGSGLKDIMLIRKILTELFFTSKQLVNSGVMYMLLECVTKTVCCTFCAVHSKPIELRESTMILRRDLGVVGVKISSPSIFIVNPGLKVARCCAGID